MSISFIIFLACLIGVVLLLIVVYNRLVRLRNQFQNAFAQIEVQLKRRYDLIPNLVETAKAYLTHERETLTAVIQARNEASQVLKQAAQQPGDAQNLDNLSQAEQGLGRALGRFNVVMEAYPDLKASSNMQQLSEELSSTENKVSFARQYYNDSVMEYNTYRQSFPAVVLAGMFGHGKDAGLLTFEDSARLQEAPKVAF